jgi:hypothetical protein
MLGRSMDTFLKYDGSISLDASSIEIMKKHGVKKSFHLIVILIK